MVGQTHRIDIGNDDLLAPWPTVFDVVEATNADEWVIVGGLMVQLHGYRAAIRPPRPTKDIDLVMDVVSHRGSFALTSAALRSIGFEADVPFAKNEPVYRFQRGREQVDVMVPDHLPKTVVPRFMMRPALSVEGGAQAIIRRDAFVVTCTRGTITVNAPDVLGALVAKGAAATVDSRNPERHVEDAALLFASIESVGSLHLNDLSRNDRKRLTTLAAILASENAPAWGALDVADQRRGAANLSRLVVAAHLD